MRRTMLLLLAFTLFASLSGCKLLHSHGVCDCDEDDHCTSRQPWSKYCPTVMHHSEPIPAPVTKLPDGKKKDL